MNLAGELAHLRAVLATRTPPPTQPRIPHERVSEDGYRLFCIVPICDGNGPCVFLPELDDDEPESYPPARPRSLPSGFC
jgi:hypothetical protein